MTPKIDIEEQPRLLGNYEGLDVYMDGDSYIDLSNMCRSRRRSTNTSA